MCCQLAMTSSWIDVQLCRNPVRVMKQERHRLQFPSIFAVSIFTPRHSNSPSDVCAPDSAKRGSFPLARMSPTIPVSQQARSTSKTVTIPRRFDCTVVGQIAEKQSLRAALNLLSLKFRPIAFILNISAISVFADKHTMDV